MKNSSFNFNTDRQNTNNFNSKNNFHHQLSSKTYNNISHPPLPPTPPTSMKVIQFQNGQNGNGNNYRKKISLSTTLQNIQIGSPILQNNSQTQTKR